MSILILNYHLFKILFLDPVVSALKKEQRTNKNCGSQTSDDEPLYDSVASDDDYIMLGGSDTNNTNSESLNNDNEVK